MNGFPCGVCASRAGFALYLAGRDGYQYNILPSGLPAGSPEECLDCACGLYLGQPAGCPLHELLGSSTR